MKGFFCFSWFDFCECKEDNYSISRSLPRTSTSKSKFLISFIIICSSSFLLCSSQGRGLQCGSADGGHNFQDQCPLLWVRLPVVMDICVVLCLFYCCELISYTAFSVMIMNLKQFHSLAPSFHQ